MNQHLQAASDAADDHGGPQLPADVNGQEPDCGPDGGIFCQSVVYLDEQPSAMAEVHFVREPFHD